MGTMIYYIVVVLTLMPWVLILAGAWRKSRIRGGRVIRLQLEGVAILLAMALAGWVILDPNFGIDKFKTELWSLYFEYSATGAFWIGLLFFFLGFFLERKPRPGLEKWPMLEKLVAAGFIIGGGLAGFVANRHLGPESFVPMPWPLARMLFTLGFLPFAVSYLRAALRNNVAPPDAFGFDED